jgi:O-antigen ligase/Flp pilus assembly protein TadD
MQASLRAWSARAMEAIWLAAAVMVLLAFNPWGANAFELPKALLLRALVLLMGLVALIRFIEDWGGTNRTPAQKSAMRLLWPTLALGLAQAAATAFSINPHTSLWGSYERQQGLLTLGAYLALFLFTAANLRTRVQAERLWIALVWGSAPVVIYGLLQALGLDPLGWHTDAASPVLSTIGRANFLGSYLALVIPLAMGRLLSTHRRWRIVGRDGILSYVLLLMGQLICLALTQARGAWIGLGVGMLAFALVWAVTSHNKRLTAVALIAALVTIGCVALLNLPNGPMATLARLPGLNRLAALSHTDEGSAAARLTIWQATLPLVSARPVLGYGPETMRVTFARVFPPQLVYYQGRHVTVDRAHNLWLDLWMSSGLVGLAAFVAFLVGFGWLAWRGLRGAADHWDKARWAALIGAVAGHLADLQFGFDLTASATIFWLVLALAATSPLPTLSVGEEKDKDTQEKFGWLPHVLPTLATLALIGFVCVRPLLADSVYWKSQQGTQSPQTRQAEAERAINLWPLEPEYYAGLAEIYMRGANPVAAEKQLAAADRLSPNDPQVWGAWGNLYAYWGDVEPRRYIQAEVAYRRVLELAPNVATYHTSLGLVLARQGRLQDGLAELERAVALDATDGTAYSHLADLYQALGRESESAWARKEGKRWSGE